MIVALLVFFCLLVAIVAETAAHHLAFGVLDVGLLVGAVFGLSRIIAREMIFEPVRECLTGTLLGQLVGCTRCVGAWVCVMLVGLYAADYTMGRIVSLVFALAGANMLLQACMSVVCALATYLEGINRSRSY